MLLPALGKAREKAYTISCLGRLNQWGKGLAMYDNDYNELPFCYCKPTGATSTLRWHDSLITDYLHISVKGRPYLKNIGPDSSKWKIYRCPAAIKVEGAYMNEEADWTANTSIFPRINGAVDNAATKPFFCWNAIPAHPPPAESVQSVKQKSKWNESPIHGTATV